MYAATETHTDFLKVENFMQILPIQNCGAAVFNKYVLCRCILEDNERLVCSVMMFKNTSNIERFAKKIVNDNIKKLLFLNKAYWELGFRRSIDKNVEKNLVDVYFPILTIVSNILIILFQK